MALTNYRVYKWLIYLLEKEADEQHAMSLKDINQRYQWDKKDIFGYDPLADRVRTGLPERKKKLKAADGKEYVEYEAPKIENKTFLRWRESIYKEFGLLIQQPIFKGVVRNRYYLSNPELLDENKNLRETIEHLVDDEIRGYEAKSVLTVSPRGRKKKAEGVSNTSMGFVSVGNSGVDYYNPNFGYQEAEEPEMVGIIQFVMTIGEALVIKYSKLSTPAHKEQKYVLEPQQLKQINGRWYIAGNLYEYGNRDTSKLVIYDVDRIQLCEDFDVEVPTYTIKEDFDIYNLLPSDWTEHFNPDKVVSMYLKTVGRFLDETPFCSTQEKVDMNVGLIHNLYKVYVKPDADFFIQYMAYGEELRAVDLTGKVESIPTDLSSDQIMYLRDLRKRSL